MDVREIPTIIPEDEFQEFLGELAEEVQIWKEKDHMGYVSITCDLAKNKRILDLAK